MLLTIAAILIDRLWLRRTPEQKVRAERIALERELADNRAAMLRLTREQGPELIAGLAAILNGSIGGRVGLGFKAPGDAGNPGR